MYSPARTLACLAAALMLGTAARTSRAEIAAPADMAAWAMPWGDNVPGDMSAADLLPAPAGKSGPIVVRDGHFYEGNQRVRFFGVNIAFAGNFPTHEQADKVAKRLARFGINCVRMHHMDNHAFPNGIFVSDDSDELSSQALDRLDYFIAALKAQGVYVDLNLHVSRWFSKKHHWANAEGLPEFDKMIDLFNPELIAANKQYAHDLLTHFNPYTKTKLAEEPAVGVIETDNENTLFLWSGEEKLAALPEPYAGQLRSLWNAWLTKHYATRADLLAAWSQGVQPAGPNLFKDAGLSQLGHGPWNVEKHDGAQMTVSADSTDAAHPAAVLLDVKKVDATNWHLQFNQAGLTLKKGQYYTLVFDAAADSPTDVTLAAQQAHAPYLSLGLGQSVAIKGPWAHHMMGFIATDDDVNARISFSVGKSIGKIRLSNIDVHEGGQLSLDAGEDPAASTVANGGPGQGATAARSRDWYSFLQQTDQACFVEMRRYIREELGAKCPITGTIGLGMLGTLSQTQMDFVDAHAYWEHPHFPHRQWDMGDWVMPDKAMVDHPAGATFWGLAATRVEGKPFTVTEYNNSAPNEWQAEGVPFISAYAALQDWDGLFLFAYTHNDQYQKDRISSFFDVEGNPVKMNEIPLASRIFLAGQLAPLAGEHVVRPSMTRMLDTASAYYYTQWPYVRDVEGVTWETALQNRLTLSFAPRGEAASGGATASTPGAGASDGANRISWTTADSTPHTGQFILRDPKTAIFIGFPKGDKPIDLGAVTIESLQTPFATIVLAPTCAEKTIESAPHLLLTAAARESNTGMKWNVQHTSVGRDWGQAPPMIEVVHATLSIKSAKPITAYALTPEGKRGEKLASKWSEGRATIELGAAKTIWYELVRE